MINSFQPWIQVEGGLADASPVSAATVKAYILALLNLHEHGLIETGLAKGI